MSGFLRKSGTNEVFSWTPTLAKRNDMQAIDDEDAKKIMELHVREKKRDLSKRVSHKETAAVNDVFGSMDEDALTSKAAEFKIKLPKKASIEEKRSILRKAAGEIAQAKVVGSTTTVTTTPESGKDEQKAEQKADEASSNKE